MAATRPDAASGGARRRGTGAALFAAGLLLGFALGRHAPWPAADAPPAMPAEAPAPALRDPVAAPLDPALPVRGDAAAPIAIEAFLDAQSPACARVVPVLARLLADYPRDVRLALRHLPAPGSGDGPLAHRALLAAERQDRLWDLFDRVFSGASIDRAALLAHAEALGLDARAFEAGLADPAFDAVLARDRAEATARGVTTTPTFFVNGRRVVGAQPYENFVAVLERERARVTRPAPR